MNWFTISSFYHSVHVSFHHFAISVYLSYTISLNKFSCHLNHHLYQYYIFIDFLSDYSESDWSYVDSSTPEYSKAASKYETSLHIPPTSLDNSPNNNSSRSNFYARSKKLRDLVSAKLPLARNIVTKGGFVCTPSIMAMH